MSRQFINTQGFTVVAGVIAVLAVSLIGFAGWKVYENQANASRNMTAGSENKTSSNASSLTVPDGYTAFTSEQIGVEFAYPKTWGKASVAPGSETSHLVRGNEYVITFTENKDVTAGVRSKDWKHDPNKGHDGVFSVIQYADASYDDLVKDEGEKVGFPAVVHHKATNSYVISTVFAGIGCDGVGELLVHRLNGNAKYAGIAFMSVDKVMDYSGTNKETGAQAEDICSEENFKKYVSSERAEEFKKIETTISNL